MNQEQVPGPCAWRVSRRTQKRGLRCPRTQEPGSSPGGTGRAQSQTHPAPMSEPTPAPHALPGTFLLSRRRRLRDVPGQGQAPTSNAGHSRISFQMLHLCPRVRSNNRICPQWHFISAWTPGPGVCHLWLSWSCSCSQVPMSAGQSHFPRQ